MKLKVVMAAAAVAGLCIAAPAAAAVHEELFVVAGTSSDNGSFMTSLTPSSYSAGIFGFTIEKATGAFAGDTSIGVPYEPSFPYTLNFSNGGTLVVASQVNSTTYDISGGGTLTETGVPEPTSWALMIVGVGMAGAGMRSARRRRASSPFRA